MRVGCGIDVHELSEGRPLVLGGVTIPFERGLRGHSDADVLTHALMDALLSAARLPDIGELYPASDPAFLDVSSLVLLADVRKRVRAAGFDVLDCDCVLMAEAPKIAPYKEAMRAHLAHALNLPLASVGLKATTCEGLGFVGRQQGMAALAFCALKERC